MVEFATGGNEDQLSRKIAQRRAGETIESRFSAAAGKLLKEHEQMAIAAMAIFRALAADRLDDFDRHILPADHAPPHGLSRCDRHDRTIDIKLGLGRPSSDFVEPGWDTTVHGSRAPIRI